MQQYLDVYIKAPCLGDILSHLESTMVSVASGLMVKTSPSNRGGVGSIPDQAAKIPNMPQG